MAKPKNDDLKLLYIITELIKRNDGKKVFHVIDENNNHHICYLPRTTDEDKLKINTSPVHKDRFVFITKYAYKPKNGEYPSVYTLTENSKIFDTNKTFQIDKDRLDAIKNPKIHTIPEVNASPKKRKLSVKAKVTAMEEVTDKISTKTQNPYKLRKITIQDQTECNITCKLWNEHAEAKLEMEKEYLFTNMEVDVYQNSHTIQSSDLTHIKEEASDNEEKATLSVIGIIDEGNNMAILDETTGNTYNISKKLLQHLLTKSCPTLTDLKKKLPVNITVKIAGTNITEICK